MLGLANKTNQLRNMVKLPFFEYKKIKFDKYDNKLRNQNTNNLNTTNIITGESTPKKGLKINNSIKSLNNISVSRKPKQIRFNTRTLAGRIINLSNTSSNTLIDVSREDNNFQNNQISHKILPKIDEKKSLSQNRSGFIGKISQLNKNFNLKNSNNTSSKKERSRNSKNENENKNLVLLTKENNNYTKKFKKISIEFNNSRKSNSRDRSLNNISRLSNYSGTNERHGSKSVIENISVPYVNITANKENPIPAGNNINVNVSNVNINVNNNIKPTECIDNNNNSNNNSSNKNSNNNIIKPTGKNINNNNTYNSNILKGRKIINDDRKFSILDIGGNTPLYVEDSSVRKSGNNISKII